MGCASSERPRCPWLDDSRGGRSAVSRCGCCLGLPASASFLGGDRCGSEYCVAVESLGAVLERPPFDRRGAGQCVLVLDAGQSTIIHRLTNGLQKGCLVF